jgi:hypothetical protein
MHGWQQESFERYQINDHWDEKGQGAKDEMKEDKESRV